MTTAATHVCAIYMRYCNGITAYILLHYLMIFHIEITKDKEMKTFLYVLSDHPTYYILNAVVVVCSRHYSVTQSVRRSQRWPIKSKPHFKAV